MLNLGPTSNQMAAMRGDNEGAAVIHTNLPTLCRAQSPGQTDDPRWETWKQKEQIQLEWQEQQALENEAYDRNFEYERKGSSGSGQLAVQDGDARYDEAEDTFPEGDPSSFQPGVPDESPQLARDGTQETFGTSQASWHSYGEVPQGTGNWRSQRPRPMPKDRKRTSLAASAQNAKAKSIPPPGPRAVWGGNAGPGASGASGSAQAPEGS